MKPGKPLRIPDIIARKQHGPKVTMLTAYDAWSARMLAASGAIDILLVGDSLGMVQLGHATTIPVTMADMISHTRAVRAGASEALVVADLPFLSHQVSVGHALKNAGRLLQAGATAVKVEGGTEVVPTVERMVASGIPVMGHLGLQPQSINVLGGFRRQGRTREQQEQLVADAVALEGAGVFAIVLECVPDEAARELTDAVKVPVIGIGSGPDCDGQVLVTHDTLALTGPLVPAFAKRFADAASLVTNAAQWFAEEVRSGTFPSRAGKRPLQVAGTIAETREAVRRARAAGSSIGFVPTMGALHAGHARLLDRAREQNKFVAASIFVNPLQFDRKQDLESYPRTFEDDLEICRQHGVDLVFAPSVEELYPTAQLAFAEVPELGQNMEGRHRPGHFRGMATVVLKLLNIVQPDCAYFGEKDVQQLAIVRRMVQDFDLPVTIEGVATVRESDGLALSSRNRLLSAEQRAAASVLWQALQTAVSQLDAGERSSAVIRNAASKRFDANPQVQLEYLDFVDPRTLQPLDEIKSTVLIAGAIRLGPVRLIDNLSWTASSSVRAQAPKDY